MVLQSEIQLTFTREELLELFSRCLKANDEDTPSSRSVLQKLADALLPVSQSSNRRKTG